MHSQRTTSSDIKVVPEPKTPYPPQRMPCAFFDRIMIEQPKLVDSVVGNPDDAADLCLTKFEACHDTCDVLGTSLQGKEVWPKGTASSVTRSSFCLSA